MSFGQLLAAQYKLDSLLATGIESVPKAKAVCTGLRRHLRRHSEQGTLSEMDQRLAKDYEIGTLWGIQEGAL